MNASLLRLLIKAYTWLLRLYPPRFRDEFADEMADVFRQAAEGAARRGKLALVGLFIYELCTLPGVLLAGKGWKGYAMMDQKPENIQPAPAPAASMSPGEIILGFLPLLILGVGMIIEQIPVANPMAVPIVVYSFFWSYPPALVGFFCGWLRGFPRWSYPYIVYVFIFSLDLSHAITPGFSLFNIPIGGTEVWGWRAFTPIALTAVLMLLVSRQPLAPFGKMLRDVWNDWTLFAYAIYGLLLLAIPIALDEVDRTYTFPVTIAAVSVLLVGAGLYLVLANRGLRTTSMLAGAFLSMLTAIMGGNYYWGTHDMVNFQVTPKPGPVSWENLVFPTLWGTISCTLMLLAVPIGVGVLHWLISRQTSRSGGADA